MDMEKFTERSRGFIQSAQTIAIRENNQRVVPEHLLKVLMDDDQGLAANLITRAGGDPRAVQRAVDEAVAKLPKVSGGDGQVYVDPSLISYAVKLVGATRRPDQHGMPELSKYLSFGASPRASISLVEASRALAYLRGRGYVLPEDLTALAADTLRHRLVLSYEALAEGLSADALIERVMARIPLPPKPMQHTA